MQDWIEIRLSVGDATDSVMNYLFELGSLGVQETETGIVAYFSPDYNSKQLLKQLQSHLTDLRSLGIDTGRADVQIDVLPDRDWHQEWKKRYKPVIASDRFIIKPTWQTLGTKPDRFVIEIDPKQAFGTGTHETTQLILRLLEWEDVPGATVLDIGTGTGILAIAACMLGAKSIIACDSDPTATAAASENIRQNNRMTTEIKLFTGTPDALSQRRQFEIILANLTKRTILAYLDAMIALLKPAGQLLLSGILLTELDEVRDHLQSKKLNLLTHTALHEWTALLVRLN